MMRGTVLIIDDDRRSSGGLQFAFIRRGWEAVVTATEVEALALLTDYEPDWVIASWDQLGGTGARFVQTVRSRVKGVRVSILTDVGAPAALFVRGPRPDLVFSKPIHADDVYLACEALAAGGAAVAGRAV